MTDESPELVEKWLAKAKPEYPIAITRGAFERFIEVPHFPYAAVIGPDGNLAYAGNAGQEGSALEGAMSKTEKASLWPKSLGKITKLMTKDASKAYAELKKLDAGGKVKEAERPYVDSFVAYLEGRAKDALSEAKSLKDGGHVLKAMMAVEAYADAKTPFPTSADSKKLLEELEALPDFKKEVSGGKAYMAAEALEEEYEYEDAFKAFKSAAKKYAGTQIGGKAKVQAERIRDSGMAGYVRACMDCRRAKRACEKHLVEVKL